MKTFFLFLALLSPLLVHARLGESISDCDIRYGGGKPGTPSAEDQIKPLVTGPGATNVTYIFKGLTVRVGFRNSEAVRLDFTRNGSSKLTEAEIQGILDGSRGSNNWHSTSTAHVLGYVSDASAFAKTDKEMKAWRQFDENVAILYNRGRSLRLIKREDTSASKGGGKGTKGTSGTTDF